MKIYKDAHMKIFGVFSVVVFFFFFFFCFVFLCVFFVVVFFFFVFFFFLFFCFFFFFVKVVRCGYRSFVMRLRPKKAKIC